tara:strand:- start:338 stop:559 length:222 start_codon:yes stop_codon:yes gene_type:complete
MTLTLSWEFIPVLVRPAYENLMSAQPIFCHSAKAFLKIVSTCALGILLKDPKFKCQRIVWPFFQRMALLPFLK